MATKYICDKCNSEVLDNTSLYSIKIINGNNTAIMNESNSPQLCETCAKALVSEWLPKEEPVVEEPIVSNEVV